MFQAAEPTQNGLCEEGTNGKNGKHHKANGQAMAMAAAVVAQNGVAAAAVAAAHANNAILAAAQPFYAPPNLPPPQDIQPDRPIGYGAFGVVW